MPDQFQMLFYKSVITCLVDKIHATANKVHTYHIINKLPCKRECIILTNCDSENTRTSIHSRLQKRVHSKPGARCVENKLKTAEQCDKVVSYLNGDEVCAT